MDRRSYSRLKHFRDRAASQSASWDEVHKAQVDRINTLTRAARGSWFGLLAYLSFVGITLLGVEDADFFLTERQTELPLVGVQIPTFLFFAVAPTLGAALYTYFHLHLMKLWDALATAPPKIEDTALSEHVSPWLVTDFALAFRAGALADRPLRSLAFVVTALLSFLAGPIVLFFFWLWSFPAHNELMTVLGCGVPLFVATVVCVVSWRHAMRRLSTAGLNPPMTKLVAAIWFLFIAGWGWLATEGTLDHHARAWFGFDPTELPESERPWWSGTPIPSMLAEADLEGVNFVDAPSGLQLRKVAQATYRKAWCAAEGIPPAACDVPAEASETAIVHMRLRRMSWCREDEGLVPDPRGARCRTRFENLDRAFAADWDQKRTADLSELRTRQMIGADLRRANLRGARLETADLQGARLEGADLQGARLEGAELRGARLERAILWRARLERANLWRARLEGADLRQARLEGADLEVAELEGADLQGARLEEANLAGAWLEGANLARARLEGANLAGARLEGANLQGARLEGAFLGEAWLGGVYLGEAWLDPSTNFRPTTLRGAGLKSIDLTDVTINKAVREAFGDGTVKLPDDLKAGEPPLEHWPSDDLDLFEFNARWRAWQAEIGYIPPSP